MGDWKLPCEIKVVLLPGEPAVTMNEEHLTGVQVLKLDLLQVPSIPRV